MPEKYTIRVDGPGSEGAIYLRDDDGADPTPDKKKRIVLDSLDDAWTIVDNVKHSCGLEAARVVRLKPKKKPPRIEYATTTDAWSAGDPDGDAAPYAPDGTGWILVGSAAASDPERSRILLFWFWKREER